MFYDYHKKEGDNAAMGIRDLLRKRICSVCSFRILSLFGVFEIIKSDVEFQRRVFLKEKVIRIDLINLYSLDKILPRFLWLFLPFDNVCEIVVVYIFISCLKKTKDT